MPRSATQRKMQMGVSGRALGIGVTLERPVRPDRRNDVWAVAGTGTLSLTPDRRKGLGAQVRNYTRSL